MKYYLAYGSNLNMAQMKHRCPEATAVGASMIEGYQLVFRRGYLTIEKKENSRVPVGIWKISDGDEKALDRYEGYPGFYYKEEMTVEFCGEDIRAMVYIMHPVYPIEKPSHHYLQTVRNGYKDFGIGEIDGGLLDAYLRTYD